MAKIRLQSLSHQYPNSAEEALRLGDFTWEDGGAYALLGPSGCGKSTLLNIISGLLVPSQGRIFFDGEDVTQLSPRQRNIAQVFQFPVIYDTMSVFDNLAFPLRNRGIAKTNINTRVGEIAELLELEYYLHKRAKGLSADQKQLISLGRGLVRSDVSAILFDEPLTVIDPHQKFQLRRKLKDIHRQFKLTLLYVTHDQSEALTFADRVAVMASGQVMQSGSPEQLFDQPAHTFVGHFIGSPGMNFLRVDIGTNGVALQGQQILLDPSILKQALTQTGTAQIGIRPEYLRISISREQHDDVCAVVPARVQGVDNCGNYFMLNLNFNDCSINVKAEQPPTSKDVFLHFPTAATKLFVNDFLVE